jgi:hypothetical protein
VQFTNGKNQSIWKECVQEAMFELDQHAFRKKLEIARMAIEARRIELDQSSSPDPIELAELSAHLHTIYALGFLKNRSEGA